MSTSTPRTPLKQLIGIPLNVMLFCLLMVLSWGDTRDFFSHPARLGVIVLLLLAMPVMTVCTGGRSKGVRSQADHRAFFPLLMFHSLFTAIAMPKMDRADLWTIPGGDFVRWFGLVVFAAGVVLRIVPMLKLGKRFASVVAVQEGHALETGGIYGLVRHPSYLGIFLMDVGFAGVYRSWLAVALLPMVFWMFARRMAVEEKFMIEQFGESYRTYMARVPKLIPGVW